MISAFQRAAKGILSILGEDALFNGATFTKINIQYGVQFGSSEGDSAAYRGEMSLEHDVATIDCALAPKSGDRFIVGPPDGKTYRLERLIKDTGYTRQFVIIEVSGG